MVWRQATRSQEPVEGFSRQQELSIKDPPLGRAGFRFTLIPEQQVPLLWAASGRGWSCRDRSTCGSRWRAIQERFPTGPGPPAVAVTARPRQCSGRRGSWGTCGPCAEALAGGPRRQPVARRAHADQVDLVLKEISTSAPEGLLVAAGEVEPARRPCLPRIRHGAVRSAGLPSFDGGGPYVLHPFLYSAIFASITGETNSGAVGMSVWLWTNSWRADETV